MGLLNGNNFSKRTVKDQRCSFTDYSVLTYLMRYCTYLLPLSAYHEEEEQALPLQQASAEGSSPMQKTFDPGSAGVYTEPYPELHFQRLMK